jgi:putative transposase
MPRTSRAIVANHYYHVINRGNDQLQRFHDRVDLNAFLGLIAEAHHHAPLPIVGACVMPNHVHLVVRPTRDDDLAQWTHWLFTTHARRYHRKHGGSGRVWQGRYKAFVIQGDAHLLTVLRYVERNALSANLVRRAEDGNGAASTGECTPALHSRSKNLQCRCRETGATTSMRRKRRMKSPRSALA